MDFFAHGFWSYIIFQHRSKRWFFPVLAGLIPDIISWLPFFFYRLFFGSGIGKPHLIALPGWVNVLYGIGHSLVTVAIVFLALYLILQKIPFFLYAWPLAIFMDVLTHTREFLPTPFLWPISNWPFPGINWGTKSFMLLNWSLICICLGYIYWKKKRR